MVRIVGRNWWAVAAAMLAIASACEEPESPKPSALGISLPTNAIQVTVITTGSDIPSGYTVVVDDQSQPVGANGVVTFIVGAGTHVVALYGVASNCTVSGENPRHVFLPVYADAGATTFSSSCVSQGGLFVSTNTTGVDLDADGYAVTVDGGASQPIATNGSVTFTALADGAHSVALLGIAANCTVSGSNSQTVTVHGGATAAAPFSLSCAQTGSGSGSLTVTTTTTGSNGPPNGYTVVVDGTSSQPIATNGSVTLTVPAGDNPVALSGVPANCTVSGANPATVTVPAGGTATTSFSVACGVPQPRVIGKGQIGRGSPTPNGDQQTFDFDVRADLTGRFIMVAYDDVQPDGGLGSLTTDPSADPATSFTAYRGSSNACSDPSRGVEFDAVGRERTGAIVSYTVKVCDNGPAGSGTDYWSFFLPSEGFGRSGIVTSGDIVKQ